MSGRLGITQPQISKYEEIIDHISLSVYQSCKKNDFNRNDGINNNSVVKNLEERINRHTVAKNNDNNILFDMH